MRTLAQHIPRFSPSEKELVVMEVLRKQILRGIFIFMLIENVFLFLRFFLRLLGADPANPFAAFIFAISAIFMFPFFGIFPQFRDEIIAGEMTIDISAFAAGFCYNILSITAMIVVQIVGSILRTKRQKDETIKKDKPIETKQVDRTFGHQTP